MKAIFILVIPLYRHFTILGRENAQNMSPYCTIESYFDFRHSHAPYAIGNIFIPNRTFLVRFGGISGEFGRAMVRILARRSPAKVSMAISNEPDMLPKRAKKIR